jgi:hypothetical protein
MFFNFLKQNSIYLKLTFYYFAAIFIHWLIQNSNNSYVIFFTNSFFRYDFNFLILRLLDYCFILTQFVAAVHYIKYVFVPDPKN